MLLALLMTFGLWLSSFEISIHEMHQVPSYAILSSQLPLQGLQNREINQRTDMQQG